jgi:hypothetical protein
MPWAEGERACPGKKFAQVELTGAVSALFADYKVEPVPEDGESMESARERAMGGIKDSRMVLLVEMLHPERVGLRWVKRRIEIKGPRPLYLTTRDSSFTLHHRIVMENPSLLTVPPTKSAHTFISQIDRFDLKTRCSLYSPPFLSHSPEPPQT